MQLQIKHISILETDLAPFTKMEIAWFLYEHLDEYGDKIDDIVRCLSYLFNPDRGGDIFLGLSNDRIVGAVVTNRTGMEGYIPENILVYIAVHREYRGNGLGKQLMKTAIAQIQGSIALHVEPDNPARILYEKLGFTNKYLEMRLMR